MEKYKHMRGSLESFLCSMDEFNRLLRCERSRADRTNSEFALLVVRKDDLIHHLGSVDEFVLWARKRLRLTDQVGWLSSESVGTLLPNTSLEGGLICMSSLGTRNPKYASGLAFRVLSYPHEWNDRSHDDSSTNWSKTYRLSGDGSNGETGGIKGISVVRGPPPEARSRPKDWGVPRWKRVFDCCGAVAGIILGFPACLLYAAFVRIVSPGPVLFRQERIGYRGRPFIFLKLRTMKISNDPSHHRVHLRGLINSDAPMTKLDGLADPRLIPGARIIRKLCIDELPQFVNVLRGEMSLVGPRPCLPYEFEEYKRWHVKRFDVLPGMTGLWQVRGKNSLTFAQMIRLDIRYTESMSPSLDLLILLLTFPAIAAYLLQSVIGRFGSVSPNLAAHGETRDPGTPSFPDSVGSDRRVDV